MERVVEKIIVSRKTQFVVVEVPFQPCGLGLDLNMVRLDNLRRLLQADRDAENRAAELAHAKSTEECSAGTAIPAVGVEAASDHDEFYDETTWQPGSGMSTTLQLPLANKFDALSVSLQEQENAAATPTPTATAATASVFGRGATPARHRGDGSVLLGTAVDAVVAEAEAASVPGRLNADSAKGLLGALTDGDEAIPRLAAKSSVSVPSLFGAKEGFVLDEKPLRLGPCCAPSVQPDSSKETSIPGEILAKCPTEMHELLLQHLVRGGLLEEQTQRLRTLAQEGNPHARAFFETAALAQACLKKGRVG